jgi:hypothetical protein
MTTIAELGAFLARETAAASTPPAAVSPTPRAAVASAASPNGATQLG